MTRLAFAIIGLAAAVSTGLVALLTLGSAAAVLVAVAVLSSTVLALRPGSGQLTKIARATLLILLGASATYTWLTVSRLRTALTDTSGQVAAADPQAVASARRKFDQQVGDQAAFRLELTEAEITALLQDQLETFRAPFRTVQVDIIDQGPGRQLAFTGVSRNGRVTVRGHVDVILQAGSVRFKLRQADAGAVRVPGFATGFIEDLINPFAARSLADSGAEIQAVELHPDSLVVVGTQPGGRLLTSATLLAGLRRQAAETRTDAQATVSEPLPPGLVGGAEQPGDIWYVALGDSLAAGVGVTNARHGYVSRFHRQLQEQDARDYGLRNFGVPGETSSSLIAHGQLQRAVDFIRSHPVSYITVNIGANDILGHLTSPDCHDGLAGSLCRKRIQTAEATYEQNLRLIFQQLRQVAPEARILFLTIYNPFSMGSASEFEAATEQQLQSFNALVQPLAERFRIDLADGFSPLQDLAVQTTHIVDARPDIHPNRLGYSLLTEALLTSLQTPRPD